MGKTDNTKNQDKNEPILQNIIIESINVHG